MQYCGILALAHQKKQTLLSQFRAQEEKPKRGGERKREQKGWVPDKKKTDKRSDNQAGGQIRNKDTWIAVPVRANTTTDTNLLDWN